MYSVVRYNKFADEHFITIPDDIVIALDLKAGDTLTWTIKDGKVYLSKQEKKLRKCND